MRFDNLEKKCRYYQGLSDYRLMPNSFVICHIDGRCFSKMVKTKFNKPFDKDFMQMMDETAKYLCEKVQGVKMAYVQSDEISLVLTDLNNNGNGTLFFEGRLCKMQSIISSMATAKFNQLTVKNYWVEKCCLPDFSDEFTAEEIMKETENMPLYEFDCKCWNVPSLNDAFAWILFRQNDCIRNSKNQFAQAYCSHKELLNKNSDEQIDLANEKGHNWYRDTRDGMKYGRFVCKVKKKQMWGEVECFRNVWTMLEGDSINGNEEFKNMIMDKINPEKNND